MTNNYFKLRTLFTCIGIFLCSMASHDIVRYSHNYDAQLADYKTIITIYEQQLVDCQNPTCQLLKPKAEKLMLLKDKIAGRITPDRPWNISNGFGPSIYMLFIGFILAAFPHSLKKETRV